MKWYKHMSDMSNDVKVKRLIRKYGVDGYGLYNYIIELIVRKLKTDSPIPDLEETSGDIAADLNMDTLRVEEIMWYCIEQGLFEQDEMNCRLVAHKVYKFLETSQTRSVELKRMIEAYKDMSQTVSDNHKPSLPEQNRTEQNRTDTSELDKDKSGKKDTHLPTSLTTKKDCDRWKRHVSNQGVSDVPPGFDEIWTAYPKKADKKKAMTAYLETRKVCGFDDLLRAVKVYAAEQRDNDSKYIKHAKTFFGPSEPWRDYLGKELTGPQERVNVISETIFDEEL